MSTKFWFVLLAFLCFITFASVGYINNQNRLCINPNIPNRLTQCDQL